MIQDGTTLKENVFTSFNELLKEFFHKVNMSSITDNQLIYITKLGIFTFIRVFEHMFFQTKSLDNAHIYAHKCQILFIEYLEQINRTDYIPEFNINDITLFIYKKTIINAKDNKNETDFFKNIMTLSDTSLPYNEKEMEDTFLLLRKYIDVLFFWSNEEISNIQRIELCQKYFEPCLLSKNINKILLVIEYIQNLLSISYSDYKIILKEILDANKKNKIKEIDDLLLLKIFCIEKQETIEKYNELSKKQFIKWLLL